MDLILKIFSWGGDPIEYFYTNNAYNDADSLIQDAVDELTSLNNYLYKNIAKNSITPEDRHVILHSLISSQKSHSFKRSFSNNDQEPKVYVKCSPYVDTIPFAKVSREDSIVLTKSYLEEVYVTELLKTEKRIREWFSIGFKGFQKISIDELVSMTMSLNVLPQATKYVIEDEIGFYIFTYNEKERLTKLFPY